MRLVILIAFLFFTIHNLSSQLRLTEVGSLPEAVSNNAVCEGVVDGIPYVYSFAGIDNSKIFSGIHLKSFRFNTITGESEQLPDIPDNQGKVACAASIIDSIIYITGGYSVNSNGSEVSSPRLHRFNILTNDFMDNGADMLVATDDHVQGVWRDSLIYVITGWSNSTNISNVQIYNPSLNSWRAGIPIPPNNDYRSFGASGTIVGDTIYYFGGASSGGGFPIQNTLRKGIIDPDNPELIEWSIETPDENINGYRMACTTVGDEVHWIGGSNVTYNYDGIAYNNSGGVSPSNQDLVFDLNTDLFEKRTVPFIPMDLRGIASINDTVKYIAGGMAMDQLVSDKVYKLEWSDTFLATDIVFVNSINCYPNPFVEHIRIINNDESNRVLRYELHSMDGRRVDKGVLTRSDSILHLGHLPRMTYIITVFTNKGPLRIKLIKV